MDYVLSGPLLQSEPYTICKRGVVVSKTVYFFQGRTTSEREPWADGTEIAEVGWYTWDEVVAMFERQGYKEMLGVMEAIRLPEK